MTHISAQPPHADAAGAATGAAFDLHIQNTEKPDPNVAAVVKKIDALAENMQALKVQQQAKLAQLGQQAETLQADMDAARAQGPLTPQQEQGFIERAQRLEVSYGAVSSAMLDAYQSYSQQRGRLDRELDQADKLFSQGRPTAHQKAATDGVVIAAHGKMSLLYTEEMEFNNAAEAVLTAKSTIHKAIEQHKATPQNMSTAGIVDVAAASATNLQTAINILN